MATFSGKDFTKHNGIYVRKLLDDILAGIPIKLGPKGETSILIDPECDAVKVLKDNLDRLDFLEPKYISSIATFQFIPLGIRQVRWTQIFKGTYSAKPANVSTEAQETISCRIMELVLASKPYDVGVVLKILPDADGSWLDHFQKQYDAFTELKDQLGLVGSYKVQREVPNKAEILQYLKSFGISRISTWTPADIWVYKDFKIPDCQSLQSFNSFFLTKLKEGSVVGISLKKIIGKPRIEFLTGETSLMTISEPVLTFETGIKNGKFKTNEFKWQFKLNGVPVKGQARIFSGRQFEPIQIEYSASGLGGHVGKCPKDIVNRVLKQYCHNQMINPAEVPKSFEAFKKSQFLKCLKFVSKEKFTDALNGLELAYNQDPTYVKTYVNAKIQALWITYLFSRLSPQDLKQVMQELFLGAKKQGSTFGPYVLVS